MAFSSTHLELLDAIDTAFSPNGSLLAVLAQDGLLSLFSLELSHIIVSLPGKEIPIDVSSLFLRWSLDSHRVLCLLSNQMMFVWDLHLGLFATTETCLCDIIGLCPGEAAWTASALDGSLWTITPHLHNKHLRLSIQQQEYNKQRELLMKLQLGGYKSQDIVLSAPGTIFLINTPEGLRCVSELGARIVFPLGDARTRKATLFGISENEHYLYLERQGTGETAFFFWLASTGKEEVLVLQSESLLKASFHPKDRFLCLTTKENEVFLYSLQPKTENWCCVFPEIQLLAENQFYEEQEDDLDFVERPLSPQTTMDCELNLFEIPDCAKRFYSFILFPLKDF